MSAKPKSKLRRPSPGLHTLSQQLREVIGSRGLSAHAVAKLADVDPGVVQRFLTGRRDIVMATADRLALALGVRLVEVVRRGRPAGPRPVAAGLSPIESSDDVGESGCGGAGEARPVA